MKLMTKPQAALTILIHILINQDEAYDKYPDIQNVDFFGAVKMSVLTIKRNKLWYKHLKVTINRE